VKRRRTPPVTNKDNWGTNPAILANFSTRFSFFLDLAANPGNRVCEDFIGEEEDALTVAWEERVPGTSFQESEGLPAYWLNCPFSLRKAFARKAAESPLRFPLVMVQPACVNDRTFHDYIVGRAAELWLPDGRLSYAHPDTGEIMGQTNFESMIAVYLPSVYRTRPGTTLLTMDRQGAPNTSHSRAYWEERRTTETLRAAFVGSLGMPPGEGRAALARTTVLLERLAASKEG